MAVKQISFDESARKSLLEGVSKLYCSIPGVTAAQKTRPPELGETGPQPLAGKFTLTIAKGRLQGDMARERDGVVRGHAKVDAAKAK